MATQRKATKKAATPPKTERKASPKKATAPARTPTVRKSPAKAATKARTKPPSKPAKKHTSTEAATPKARPVKLTEMQQRFVDEYLIDLNGTQAAIRSGYSAHTAAEQAYDLLRRPHIQAAIAEGRRKQQERTEISADRVLREAWSIVTADARELVQVKVGCCRHCHGEGHKYQRTLSEFNHDFGKWMEQKKDGKTDADFEEAGGIGFDPLKPAHPECPECCGDGRPRVVAGDTRNLSAAAASLYAGAKQTKEGLEIKTHDKLAAMEKLFRHMGLYEEDNKQKTDPLTSLLHAIAGNNTSAFKPVAIDPEQPASTPLAAGLQQDSDDD